MTTPIVHAPADAIHDLAAANGVEVHSIGGIDYFKVVNPVTGAVVRVVGSHTSVAERARRKSAAMIAEIHADAGWVPEQRVGVAVR